ncbi:hypothetical protein HS088_TW03G00181 [Tripterygium wilfordii]|uniref:Uncharacterized protein n=1 Tax=Tripterygium wilfordii TaxID=458696 RepID=A0A7J7DU12_TRIWF|nr:hypothetical protein HS088_TW03G00181 [Tripterygium wilfordii]
MKSRGAQTLRNFRHVKIPPLSPTNKKLSSVLSDIISCKRGISFLFSSTRLRLHIPSSSSDSLPSLSQGLRKEAFDYPKTEVSLVGALSTIGLSTSLTARFSWTKSNTKNQVRICDPTAGYTKPLCYFAFSSCVLDCRLVFL